MRVPELEKLLDWGLSTKSSFGGWIDIKYCSCTSKEKSHVTMDEILFNTHHGRVYFNLIAIAPLADAPSVQILPDQALDPETDQSLSRSHLFTRFPHAISVFHLINPQSRSAP